MSTLPIIELPHTESSPKPCTRCGWNGDHRYLVRRANVRDKSPHLEGRDCQAGPFECVSCEIMRLLLFQVAQNVGHAILDSTSISIFNGKRACIYGLGTRSTCRELFIFDDSQPSKIDEFGINRRRLLSTGAQWASDLISNCRISHPDCQSQMKDTLLPTRLINVQPSEGGGNPCLRLQETENSPSGSKYVALSYCWGDYEPACMTTSTTLPSNKNSILWNDLPRTFQDAANFTLALGIDFLWIDSICIIQGDSDDWDREAAKMYTVYKNSYVTLAALCGCDSRHGLHTCSMEESSSPFVRLRTAQGTHVLCSRPCHYLDSVIQDNNVLASEPAHYPLLSRAWTYQERTVSPRVIFFTESEMIFQCHCHVTCECGSSDDYYCHDFNLTMMNKAEIGWATRRSLDSSPASPTSTKSTGSDREEMERRAQIWRHNVVSNYSGLNIKFPRDRLPAIGAIAEQFQLIRPNEKYLTGLWSGSLLDDLLWGCHPDKFDKQNFTRKENLARRIDLPTWSWASIDSPKVYWLNDDYVVHKARFESHCEYTKGETFGTLQSSRLILKGRILVCMLEWVEDADDSMARLSFKSGDVWTEIKDREIPGCVRPVLIKMDCDQDGFQCLPPQQTVHLMEISTAEPDGDEWMEWNFLLLRLEAESQGQTPVHQVFTRGGIVSITEKSPLDDSLSREDSSLENVPSEQLDPDWFETVMEEHSKLTTCKIQ